MARKTWDELQEILKRENCSRWWSWSRVHCFQTSPYEYYLKYIIKAKEDRQDCIYTTTGGLCHEIIEKFYSGEIKYENMINEFEDSWTVARDISQLKFDRNDEEKDVKIGNKYYENLQHFFRNHAILKNKPMIEQFVKIKIGANLFQGYIDCCFKDDDGNLNIIDWKTSSIYKGAKAEEECGQLVLYAIGLNQAGVPMDKIRIAWNFLKYCTIQYEQKNGAIKTRDVDRCEIGKSLQSNARMWLKEFGYGDEADSYLMALLDANSIDVLPEEVQEKYVVSDCYVYVDLTDKLIDKWTNTILNTIKDICLREKDYNETKSEMAFWDTDDSVKSQSYYFSTLCAYSANLHKPYKKYLEKLDAQVQVGSNLDEDFMIAESVFEPNTNAVKTTALNNDLDLSWLDDIEI